MFKKKMLGTVAFAILVIPALLLLPGCPLHIDSLYGLKVAGDGAGGAIAIYEERLGGNIYVQKISPDGKTMWGDKGVLLDSGYNNSYSYSYIQIVSDGSGGAVVSWPGSSLGKIKPTFRVARIDTAGKIPWQRDFSSLNQMTGDGSGGAIVALAYTTDPVLALTKLDSQGDFRWGSQGVTAPSEQYQDNSLQLISDAAGGAVAVWEEFDPQPGSTPGNATVINRIVAQRIDSNGKLLWGEDGALLFTTPEGTWVESPQSVSDGSGGIVAGWFQVTNLPPDSSGPRSQILNISSQKVDAGGKVLWAPGGILLTDTTGPGTPVMVSDGSGGAVAVWRDNRHDASSQNTLYAQRVDAAGNLKWQAGGVKVSSTSLNPRPQIVIGNPGEAIVAYSFQEDGKILRIQKLDSIGQTAWQENGVSVTENGFASASISSDGQGGAIVGWGVGKGIFTSEKAFVQRISADGKLLWGIEGIQLNK